MRTKASIKGHSIHQMMIPFPLAFLSGALLFDIAGRVLNYGSFWQTGFYLASAGVLMGLAAALPGLIDLTYSVPPESTAQKRAHRHMGIMVTVVLTFSVSIYLRKSPEAMPEDIPLLLELIGAGLLFTGAWMGGTLVNRNFIGPDHRYAFSGKWKEATVDVGDKKEVVLADENELKVNQMKLIRIDEKRIVLGRTEQGYVAFDDRCTHRGGSLAAGVMICGTAQCLWHGSQFNVDTGEVKAGPAEEPIKSYKVEVRDGKVIMI